MNPLDKFFLELNQFLTVEFFAGHAVIAFQCQPSGEAIAICKKLATAPGFSRIPHRSGDWDCDDTKWFFSVLGGVPRVPLAIAILESFKQIGIDGVTKFSVRVKEFDPSFPFDTMGMEITKSLEELQGVK